MSDSLETTTDSPVPGPLPGPEPGSGEGDAGAQDLCWEDSGLPVELQKGMDNLRVNRELTDVTLRVQGEDFPCHRAVLAAASNYFRAMFLSGLRESHEEFVEMKGLDCATMRTLLDYTYTGRATLTETNVQRILEAASQFQFLRVVEACSSFLSKSLQLENCVEILNLAESHVISSLKTTAQDFIISQFTKVVARRDFLQLPADSLQTVLQSDDLDVTFEEFVFDALMHWVRGKPEERSPALGKLLAHVRLPLLEPAFFVNYVESDELIRQCKEAFPLLQEARHFHLAGREVVTERTKPRVRHFLSEVFLIIGGCTKDERFISTVTCLDPLRRSRLDVARLPFNEQEEETHNKKWVEFACATFRNEVYISGGKETQSDVWKYNGALDKWIRIESLTVPRWRHKMAVHQGKVYVIGGFDGNQRLSSVEAYDPFHNRWRQATRLAEAVSSFAAASFDKWIYVIGGGPDGKMATDKVQCWQPGTESWETKAPIPVETKCTNAVTFNNCIYVVGGAMHAMYCYSPLLDSWSVVTRLGERASCNIAACNNKIFITGGRDYKNQVISTVMCWDVSRGVLTEECVLPMGVSHHGSVTLMKSYCHKPKSGPAADSQSLSK